MPLAFTPRPATPRIHVTTMEGPWAWRLHVLFLLLATLLLSTAAQAQRCLEISILGLMGQHLHVPGDPAANFNSCQTKVNENGQVEITSYGQDLADMDSMVIRTMKKFTVAIVPGSSMGVTAMTSQEDAQKMAEEVKNMTPEQQQAWAMKYAAQQMHSTPRMLPEDPAMAKLVGNVDEAYVQLGKLNMDFSARFRTINGEEAAELDKEPVPTGHECPEVDRIGFPSCGCLYGVWGKHFQCMLDIEKKYDAQKIELLTQLIAQTKAIVGQAEADISTLRNGDALNNPSLKQQLLSFQSGIFSEAFAISGSVIEHIRTESSDIYVNKVNCDKLKYNRACD